MSASACWSAGPTETRSAGFDVTGPSTLVVSTFNGRITVTSGSGSTVQVEAELRGADKIGYRATQDGNTITITAEELGSSLFQSPGANIEVVVPASTTVELFTSNGSIEARGIAGPGTLRTSNGGVTLTDTHGDWDIETSNGSINVSLFEGAVNLKTSNGTITFDGEFTPGSANTMTTSNGRVTVTVKGTPSVQLDAATSNGTVSSQLPLLASDTGDRRLVGTIGKGESTLTIRTWNGSITVQ